MREVTGCEFHTSYHYNELAGEGGRQRPPYYMAKQILDYDPDTHTTQYHDYDPVTDITIIETVQDVEPYLKRNNELRKNADYTKQGIKNEFWHYASIPNSVIDIMSDKYDLDVFNKDQMKDVVKVINRDFPYLKVTDRHHA